MAEFGDGECDVLLDVALDALSYHDEESIVGPGINEGAYYHPTDYDDPGNHGHANQPAAPFNWQSAVGRALWTAYLLTEDIMYRDRAVMLAHYCKNRVILEFSARLHHMSLARQIRSSAVVVAGEALFALGVLGRWWLHRSGGRGNKK
jgi:hypothetical protein